MYAFGASRPFEHNAIARMQYFAYAAPMISVVLPTYNEAENLPLLLARLASALSGEQFEVVVVDDDSPDHTGQVALDLQQQYAWLSVIRRTHERGLSSAVVRGFDAAKGDILVVMDSDLQHDPSLVQQLASCIRSGAVIAVASRYMQGGSVGEWVRGRRILSRIATYLAQTLPPVRVSDPMSGFFALRADIYRQIAPRLRPSGFKILLEILAHLPAGSSVAQLPLVFQPRVHGSSKLSLSVEAVFLWQIARIAFMRLRLFIMAIACMMLAGVIVAYVW